jgi:hypothetical protein
MRRTAATFLLEERETKGGIRKRERRGGRKREKKRRKDREDEKPLISTGIKRDMNKKGEKTGRDRARRRERVNYEPFVFFLIF